MQERPDVSASMAVFAVCEDFKLHLSSVLKQFVNTFTVVRNLVDLDKLLEPSNLSVVLLAMSDHADHDNLSAGDQEFQAFMQFLPRLHQGHSSAHAILLTPVHLDIQKSCQAVANGITAIVDYQQPDFNRRLIEHIAAAHRHFLDHNDRQRELALENLPHPNGLVGVSRHLSNLVSQARKAAQISDAPVIIYGESGTGKQRIAEIIHQLDTKRCEHPFICVNCAAITGTLAESELFGHKKGAFTGATEDRLGYFRSAHQGSILLDEISELTLSLQPKILRVLQEGLVMPVGSDKEFAVDVRVIAATNRNLGEMVKQGKFRLDLFQRLNVIQLNVPSLRQRAEDIPMLFQAFLLKYAHYYHGRIDSVDPRIYEILASAIGPGNIRELENIVRQILAFKDSGCTVEITDLPRRIIQTSLNAHPRAPRLNVPDQTIDALIAGSKRLADAVDEYEKFILARLIERGVNQSSLADRLGITRRTLYNKLQKYRLR